MTKLNPIYDVIGVTSLSQKDQLMAFNNNSIGSEFNRLHPEWAAEQAALAAKTRQSPWKINKNSLKYSANKNRRLVNLDQFDID